MRTEFWFELSKAPSNQTLCQTLLAIHPTVHYKNILSHSIYFQIIMMRLQRVTFLALHNYLGLTTELFNPVGLYQAVLFYKFDVQLWLFQDYR